MNKKPLITFGITSFNYKEFIAILIRILFGPFIYNKLRKNFYFFFNIKKFELEEKIFFLHISRAGGTALTHVFNNRLNPNHEIKITKLNHSLKLYMLNKKQKYIFNFRNPITRFYSGFYERLRKGQPRLYSEHSILEKFFFNMYKDCNIIAEELYSKNLLKKIKAHIAIRSIKLINEPLTSWFYINDLENNPPIFIFEQENLNYDS